MIGGFDRKTGTLDVIEADIGRKTPDMIIARAIELQRQYRCTAWAVETVQFQEFLYTELIKRASAAGVPFPAVQIKSSTDKEMRIIGLQPHIKNEKIRLHRSQHVLIEQLRFWPEADHDDGPDALEMLWKIAHQFTGDWDYTPIKNRDRYSLNEGFNDD